MLTLKECKKIIDPKGETYTNEQLQLMLEFLNELAVVVLDDLNKKEDEKKSRLDVAGI